MQGDKAPSGVAYEAFDRICEELFAALVLAPAGSHETPDQLNDQGFTSVRVLPSITDGTPILVNRTMPSGPYWDDPMTLVKPTEIELGFTGFFDWDPSGSIDMRYLRVRVLRCSANPVLDGREALIELSHSQVVVVLEGKPSPTP
jgi:hypothetical protein